MFDSFRQRARTAATLGIAAALVVAGVALAQGGSNGNSEGSTALAGKRMPPPPPLGGAGGPGSKDLTYAELHVQHNGQAEVIRMDRGEIAAVGDSSITLTENDGSEVTIPVDDSTKVFVGPGQEKAVSDLEVGEEVTVCGPDGGTAKTVMLAPKGGQMPAPPPGQPQMRG